jgi:hypothetical protein
MTARLVAAASTSGSKPITFWVSHTRKLRRSVAVLCKKDPRIR